MSAYATYIDPDTGTEFRWHGGAYIDVGYTTSDDTAPYGRHPAPDEFVALECINVWNYATDTATIEFSEFEDHCREWLADNDD